MTSYRISRLNPKSGLVEQPYRDKEGQFVLADPAGGAQRHHAKFAVKVGTTAEAVTYLERGYPIRMTDGQSAASLVGARSVTITPVEIEGEDESSLGSAASRNPLPAKEAVMDELRQLLCVQAGHIALAGSMAAAAAFIGFESEKTYPYIDDEWKAVDLSRFNITWLMSRAYDYAYQCGEYWGFDDAPAEDIKAFREGIPSRSVFGDAFKAQTDEGLCWRVSETAYARWALGNGNPLSIRELSLLANITESATRTSLSRESLSAPDGKLSAEQALAWLQGRRGFIPTKGRDMARKDEAYYWSVSAFRKSGLAEGLQRVITDWKQTTPEQVRKAAGVDRKFMDGLLQGRPELDIDALQRVGRVLEVDIPQFVGLAVQEALRARAEQA